MISKILGSTLVAVCMTVGGSAFAQSHESHHKSRHNAPPRHSAHGNDHGYRAHAVPAPRRVPARRHDYHRRGAGPGHNFYRGGWLPAHYRTRRYIVHDWRGRRLSAPPRGYYWVQTGGDFVLAAIATGLIAQIILNN